jgi:hypothetical protein
MYDDLIDADDSTESDDAAANESEPFRVRKWGLGDHSMQTSVAPDDLLDDAERNAGVDDELASILMEAAEMVESTSVRDFECPVCGLNHGHGDSKHDIRSAFNVEPEFADAMEMCPYCHCGANELAMLVDFFHFISVPVFADQHEFESVLEMPHGNVRAIVNATNEVTYEEANEAGMDLTGRGEAHLSLDDAIAWVARELGVETLVPEDIEPDLRMFYRRVQDIKNSANNAPIPQEARATIEDGRADIQSSLQGDSDVPDEPR